MQRAVYDPLISTAFRCKGAVQWSCSADFHLALRIESRMHSLDSTTTLLTWQNWCQLYHSFHITIWNHIRTKTYIRIWILEYKLSAHHIFLCLPYLYSLLWHSCLKFFAVRKDSPIKKSRMRTLVVDSILFPNRPGLNCQSSPVVVHTPTTHTRCIWCTISLSGEQPCHFSTAGNNILSFPKNISFQSFQIPSVMQQSGLLNCWCHNLPRLNGICPWKLIGALQLSIICLELL